jgi:endonuclease/exonuclease/phosphatase (EEP) superfamily protein YafD
VLGRWMTKTLLIYAAVIGLERRKGLPKCGPATKGTRHGRSRDGDEMDDDNPIFRFVAGAALTLAILALFGGYLGWLHPLGDSLAVGRPFAVVAVLLLAVVANMAGLQMASFGAMLLAMITGLQVFMAFNWPGPPGRLSLYQKNLRFDNAALADLEADIRAVNPMMLTLQEVSEPNLTLLAALKGTLPHQLVCPGGAVGGTAVATWLTPVEEATVCAPGLAAMKVRRNDAEFWIVSVHLHWPWPFQQADQTRELLPVLARLDGSVIMAGDFNMVRWAHSVIRLAAAARVEPAGPTMGTYFGLAPWLHLPIDHVFSPSGGRVAPRSLLGSDHLGLVAGLEL